MAAPDHLARSLVDAAFELHRRRLWLESPGDALFLVRVPGEEHPLVATIVGQGGDHFGIFVAHGAAAFGRMVRFVADDEHQLSDFAETTILTVSMDLLYEIPPEYRTLLQRALFSTRRENLAPTFMAVPPHQPPRPVNRTEARVLLAAIRAVVASRDAGEFRPFPLDRRRRRILELRLEGEGRQATTTTKIVPWPESAPLASSEPDALAARADLPRPDEDWSAGNVLPRTLDEWMEADRIATSYLLELADQAGADGERPLIRYFGGGDVAVEVVEQLEAFQPMAAYFEWFAADYRATKRSKTLLEKLLAKKTLPPWQRVLFEARANARLSVYRIVTSTPG